MNFAIDPNSIVPLIKAIVTETVTEMAQQQIAADGRLTLTEAEAAHQLGLTERQLADERRRGRIAASSIVGRRIRYLRQDLIAYMLRRRVGGAENNAS